MKTRTWWAIIVLLLVIILALAWFLFATPTPAPASAAATSTPATSTPITATTTAPLSASVTLTSPQPNALVGKTFTVAGEAPGPWFFEAVFPIQVRDKDSNVIGNAQGQAQGDWEITGLVTFTSTMNISGGYTGPATLILLKDNESGLPENDDSVSVPIVIQ